jgi:hypothetical protein
MKKLNLVLIYKEIKSSAKNILNLFSYAKTRYYYPYTLPSQIGVALGIELADSISYPEFLLVLSQLPTPPKLARYMCRATAEKAFRHATRCERYDNTTRYFFRFAEGWVEFELLFDENNKLRRLFLHHRSIQNQDRIEITLAS